MIKPGFAIWLTGHKQMYRDAARQHIGQFVEVNVECSLVTCMKWDKYAK